MMDPKADQAMIRQMLNDISGYAEAAHSANDRYLHETLVSHITDIEGLCASIKAQLEED